MAEIKNLSVLAKTNRQITEEGVTQYSCETK